MAQVMSVVLQGQNSFLSQRVKTRRSPGLRADTSKGDLSRELNGLSTNPGVPRIWEGRDCVALDRVFLLIG